MAISTLIFVLSVFLLVEEALTLMVFFVQVLNKRKGRFLLDKNVSHLQPIQENTSTLIILARKINIGQILMRVIIREDTCFYFDLGKKVIWRKLGVLS